MHGQHPLRCIPKIPLLNSDGTYSALLTNVLWAHPDEILELYYRRWGIETYYRDEKFELKIEKFHSKKVNGILQELYAIAIVVVIAQLLSALVDSQTPCAGFCQFKNACISVAQEAAVLACHSPERAILIFEDLLACIERVRYRPPKFRRPSAPRYSKAKKDKWVLRRGQVMKKANT